MYCLCVNVYCHRVTTKLQLTNISYHIISYHIISYHIISYHILFPSVPPYQSAAYIYLLPMHATRPAHIMFLYPIPQIEVNVHTGYIIVCHCLW